MLKPKFSLRISEADRKELEDGFEKIKKHNEAETDWEKKWDFRRDNSSLGAFLVNQAKKQTKADISNIAVLETKKGKSKGSPARKAKKGRGRKH